VPVYEALKIYSDSYQAIKLSKILLKTSKLIAILNDRHTFEINSLYSIKKDKVLIAKNKPWPVIIKKIGVFKLATNLSSSVVSVVFVRR
jgi:hypothetical protein